MTGTRDRREPGLAAKALRCACAAALAGMALPAASPWATEAAYAADGGGTSYDCGAGKVESAAGEAAATGKKVLLKQLMADSGELGKTSTISELYEQDDFQEKIVTQYAAEADVYEAGGRYYADLGAASDRGLGDILDWAAIADDDAFDPEDISSSVTLDEETGLAEIDPSAFQDGKTPVVQTLVAVDPAEADECGVDVEVDNDGTRCTAVARAQTVTCDTLDVTTTVPVATPETAGGVALEDLEVRINGSEDAYLLVDGETAAWDSGTGELTIAESPSVVKSVSVKVASKGVLEKVLGTGRAYAATTKADDLKCLKGVDGEAMELTSIDRETFATGQLYTYSTYIAAMESWSSSTAVTPKSIRNSIKNTIQYNYLPTSAKSQAVINANYKSNSWSEYTSAVGSVDKLSELKDKMYLANHAFTPPKTATTKAGKKQSFKGFTKTSKASTSYYKNHLLSAACIDIKDGITNPTGNKAKDIKEGEYSAAHGDTGWCYGKGTVSMRVLKFDKSSNYAILSFVLPTMYMQAGNAVYKVKVAEAEPEDAAISLVKTSADEALTANSDQYSLKNALFGVFDTEKKAEAAVKAASANNMADDDDANDDPEAEGDGEASEGDDSSAEAFDAEEYAERNAVAAMTTDASGKASCDGLDKYSDAAKKTLATYYVAELKAPKGFKLSSEVKTVKVKDSTTTANPVAVTFADEPSEVTVGVYKSISNPEFTEGNPNYSLEGTAFGVYASRDAAESDADGSKAVTTITVSYDGERYYGEAGGLGLGTYYVKETAAADGFGAGGTVYEVDATTPGTHVVAGDAGDGSVGNDAKGDPLLINKVDADTGEAAAQGGASLARAQFTIRHYALDIDAEQTAEGLSALTPDAEWVVQLDGNGKFEFKKAGQAFTLESGTEAPYLLESSYKGVADAEARVADGYLNEAGEPEIPYGWVTVEETKAPEGYQLEGEVHVLKMVPDYSDEQVTVTCDDEVVRGDVTLEKRADDGTPLAHVPFRITNKATGEKHVVVTDSEGRFDSSKASNTNSADGDNDGYAFAAEAAAALAGTTTANEADGCWFGDSAGGPSAAEDQSKGAFQYGTYTIEELPSPANWGRKLIEPFDFEVSGSVTGLTYDQGTIVDETIRINTTASDSATGGKDVTIGHDATVTDDVELHNLNDSTDYLLTATLMDKATGLPVEDAEGNAVTASAEVATGEDTPETVTQSIELTFDTALIDCDADLVVFERLTDAGRPEYDVPVAVHEDLDDEGQTVRLNGIKTTAVDKTDGDKVLLNSKTAKIRDSVEYTGLKEGASYTMRATLADADGNEVAGSGEASFKGKRSGTVDVTVELDASKMGDGDEVTVFEELYEEDGDVPVATHKVAGDEGQTVSFTDVPTVVPGTPDASTPKTGADVTWALVAAAAAALAAAACAVTALARRRKPKPAKGGWNG